MTSQEFQPAPYGTPVSVSRRLLIRHFDSRDIKTLASVAREHHKVDATADVYRPDEAQDARSWLESSVAPADETPQNWTVCASADERIIGYAGLNHIDTTRRQAQLRFWIGCGVRETERSSLASAKECVEAIVDFAFRQLTLCRVYALQLVRQPRPGHILASIDMNIDGLLRKRVHSLGVFEDIACWAITADMWAARRRM